MKTTKLTGIIRITKIPEGEAPLKIREAWVGLILPCDPILGFPESEKGVLSREKSPRNRYGFNVPQDEAMVILEEKRPKAYLYWKEHGFPKANEFFHFAEEEAVIIGGISRQKIVEVTDEMQGHPTR